MKFLFSLSLSLSLSLSSQDSKLSQDSESDKGGIFLTLVVRKDGIVNLEMHNLTAETPAVATTFKKAVNSLTRNMLMAHAAPAVFLKKQWVEHRLSEITVFFISIINAGILPVFQCYGKNSYHTLFAVVL